MLAESIDRQLAARPRAARSGVKFSTLLRSVCVLGLGALVLGLAWHEQPVGVVADDAIYLLMADRLSPFAAGTSDSAFIDRYTHFPPLYPLVLAALGGGSEAILPARLVSAGCLMLGLLATWAWLRREVEPWAGARARSRPPCSSYCRPRRFTARPRPSRSRTTGRPDVLGQP